MNIENGPDWRAIAEGHAMEAARLQTELDVANTRIEDLTTAANRCINDALRMADSGRDAARYRWLRSDDIGVPSGQREINVYMERLAFREDQSDELLTGQEMDAAIDAAMAAQQGEQAPAEK